MIIGMAVKIIGGFFLDCQQSHTLILVIAQRYKSFWTKQYAYHYQLYLILILYPQKLQLKLNAILIGVWQHVSTCPDKVLPIKEGFEVTASLQKSMKDCVFVHNQKFSFLMR